MKRQLLVIVELLEQLTKELKVMASMIEKS